MKSGAEDASNGATSGAAERLHQKSLRKASQHKVSRRKARRQHKNKLPLEGATGGSRPLEMDATGGIETLPATAGNQGNVGLAAGN